MAQLNGSKWITPRKRRAIYVRDDLRCIYCGKGIEDGISFTLDHLVPRELGGDNSARNLVTSCPSCNSAKGAKTLKDFYMWLRDKGVETDQIGQRVRRNTRRKLRGNFRI